VLLLGLSFGVLDAGGLESHRIVDTPVYERYGEAVLDGRVPYRDFFIEYPPGALPVFVLPALAPDDRYGLAFLLEMCLVGAAAVVLVAFVLAREAASPARLFGATALAGLSPLALGSVVLSRYDLWPALLTVGALAALVAGRDRVGHGILGLAIAAKVYPVVIVPIALLYTLRRKGGREAVMSLAVLAVVVMVVFIPFGIVAPGGSRDAIQHHANRPLQIESLGSALLLIAHEVGSYEPTVVTSFGSQNLVGGAPDVLATLQVVLQVVAVVSIWVLFATRRGTRAELLAAAAAAVAAFAALGKVLSPQFLIWLMPLVPLVAGGIGLVAAGIFFATLVLTHVWFPDRYWNLVGFEAGPVWLLLARDVTFVALAAVLATAIRARSGSPHSE
jgi:hypothetical protein